MCCKYSKGKKPLNLQVTLSLVDGNHISDEQLGIGTATWAILTQLQEEHDLKPFFTAVRKFYIASTTKMIKHFPFGDSLLKDLSSPTRRKSYSVETIIGLAKRFPQLHCNARSNKEEFVDFTLSGTDLPPLS